MSSPFLYVYHMVGEDEDFVELPFWILGSIKPAMATQPEKPFTLPSTDYVL